MKNLLVIALLLSVNIISAQNLKNVNFKVNYLRYPSHPLPKEIKTYSKEISVGSLSAGKSRSSITSRIDDASSLPGYDFVDNDSDLTISISYSQFRYSNREYQSEKKESKDKDGKVTRWTEYWYNYEYKLPIELVITDNVNNEEIYSNYVNGSQDYISASTSRVTNYDRLKSTWESELAKAASGAESKNLSSVQDVLSSKYGFAPVKQYTTLKEVKKFKKYDFSAFNENVQLLKQALEMIEPKEIGEYLSDKIKMDLNEAIDYFEGQFAQMDPASRKAQINSKIGGVILNNLAIAYFWLGKFDAATEKIELTKDTKAKGWVYAMERNLSERKERLEANGFLK